MTIHGKLTIATGLLLYPLVFFAALIGPINCTPPLPLVLPMFLGIFGLMFYLALILAGPIMWVWNRDAFDGATQIPAKSKILFVTAILLSVAWSFPTIPPASVYCGNQKTLIIYGISLAWVILLTGIWWLNQRRPSFYLNLLFHLLMFGWLLSYAFPVVMTDTI
jgi:hypothetical protein